MQDYKEFAVDFAYEAGKIIKENFSFGMEKKLKSDGSPVTKTDIHVNTLLIQKVKERYPDHRILAEEESDMDGDSKYVWVCDPVDGTIPFSHGIRLSTFSLALTKSGESILGVVYDPFNDNLFVAEKGKGAYLNGERLKVSNIEKLRGSVAACDFYQTATYDVSKFVVHAEMVEGVKIMKFCSYVISAMMVALGEFTFALFPGNSAHDAAAAKIIIEEAGGKATNIFGDEDRYDQPINGLLVSNGVLHKELLESIVQRMKKNESIHI